MAAEDRFYCISLFQDMLQCFLVTCLHFLFSSLLKVHLQLRGFSVFLDIDRLRAGKFDENLLMNIKLAKHFLLVLTNNALDRCIGDSERQDWVHKVIRLDTHGGKIEYTR